MSERALRDQLEQDQGAIKLHEAELVAEHAPRFLTRRAELMAALATAREQLEASKDVLAEGLFEHTLAVRRVDVLDARERAGLQRDLHLLPLLAACLLISAGLAVSLADVTALGVSAAFFFGLVFGPRVVAWLRPGPERGVLAPTLRAALLDRAVHLAGAAALSALLGLVGEVLSFSLVMDPTRVRAWLHVPAAQLHLVPFAATVLLGGAVLLALWAAERTAPTQGSLRFTMQALAALCSGSVVAVAIVAPSLLELALLPLAPLYALLHARWRGPRSRPWHALVSFGCAVVVVKLAFDVSRRALDAPPELLPTGLFTVAALAVLGLVLAARDDLASWPRLQASTLGLTLSAIATAGIMLFVGERPLPW